MDFQKVITDNPFLEGTFIQELLETMATGQFIYDIQDEVAEGEKVIGEMNNLEKAAYVLLNKYEEIESKIVDYFRGETDETHTPEEEAEMNRQLATCRARFRVASRLMWENIETRLAVTMESGARGIGIRADFKIVQIFNNLNAPIKATLRDRFKTTLRKLLGGE